MFKRRMTPCSWLMLVVPGRYIALTRRVALRQHGEYSIKALLLTLLAKHAWFELDLAVLGEFHGLLRAKHTIFVDRTDDVHVFTSQTATADTL